MIFNLFSLQNRSAAAAGDTVKEIFLKPNIFFSFRDVIFPANNYNPPPIQDVLWIIIYARTRNARKISRRQALFSEKNAEKLKKRLFCTIFRGEGRPKNSEKTFLKTVLC